MSVKGIVKYMAFSTAVDLRREKDRYLRLPDGDLQRSVLMSPNRAASFSAACSRRVIGAVFGS